MRKKHETVLAVAIIVAFVGTAVFLPGLIRAGDLEPSGPPAPTMKTLDEIPPVWSQILPADDGPDPCNSSRFECVMGGEAVLDKETGLVWEKFPDTRRWWWSQACYHCFAKMVANRKGWRLPTVEELASLVDMNGDGTGRSLPSGHPFSSNVQPANHYWSSTTSRSYTYAAWQVQFGAGVVSPLDKSELWHAWCVRGGHGHDAY